MIQQVCTCKAQDIGYMLGMEVVCPQVGKVDPILSPERPTTKSQVKSFLGLVGWYRHLITGVREGRNGFSTLYAPLTDLTKNNLLNKVQWTKQCEESFQALKRALGKDPVLKSPHLDKSFVLHTHAPELGFGAALLQGDQDKLRLFCI